MEHFNHSVLFAAGLMLALILIQSCDLDESSIKYEIDEILLTDFPDAYCAYEDGIAILTGKVQTSEEKIKLENKIRRVRYVKVVQNKLSIDSNSLENTGPDKNLYANITNKLTAESCDGILVKVKNGIVTLSGRTNNQDFHKIMRITCDLNPKQIKTNIILTDK